MPTLQRIRELAQRAAIDVTALRVSKPFRRMFGAQMLSGIGQQVTIVTMMYQVQHLTHSTLDVGYIGLAQILPTVGFGLVGGAIADAMSRRRLLIIMQVGLIASALSLVALARDHHAPLWGILVLAAIGAGLSSVGNTTRSAVVPMTVDADTLGSAVQLREVMTQAGRVLGPVVGGALIAAFSIEVAYCVDAVGFLWALFMYAGLPDYTPVNRRRFELSSITEGLRFVTLLPVLAATFIADLIAMILGMPRAVFPALADNVFHVGAFGFGLLSAAPAAGAVIGLAFVGLSSRIQRQGLGVLLMVGLWGVSIAAFGLIGSFTVGLVLLAIAGGADMFSAIFRQTMLLKIVPDELRGRLSAVHIMVVTGGPPVGDFEAGTAADAFGLRPSVIIGGLGCVAGITALGALIPSFATWRDPGSPIDATTLQPSLETPI